MPIENELKRIADALEKLVELKPEYKSVHIDPTVKVMDVKATTIDKGDSLFGEVTKDAPKEKPKSKKKVKSDFTLDQVKARKSKKEAKLVVKKEAKPVVKKEAKKAEKLTKEDVVKEARVLVDGYRENRRGFEKAKQILNKLGAPEMDLLASEKFAEAINEFRKAVKKFGDNT